MTRVPKLFTLGMSLALLAVTWVPSAGAVTYRGHPVTVRQVGAIDAYPCSDPNGCLKAIVDLKYRHHTTEHLVRCGHPKHLHVVKTHRFNGERWVTVFACSKSYEWRLPR